MNPALTSSNLPTALFYVVSLIVIIVAIVDIVRRSPHELPMKRKTIWITSFIVGWLLLGIVGAAIAIFYLTGPRRRMDAQRR